MRLNLRLGDELYDQLLELVARKEASAVEKYIVDRLPMLASFEPAKHNVLLTQNDITVLNKLLDVAIQNGSDLTNAVSDALKFRVGGLDIQLPSEDVAFMQGNYDESYGTWEDYVKQQILCALEFYFHGSVTRDLPQ